MFRLIHPALAQNAGLRAAVAATYRASGPEPHTLLHTAPAENLEIRLAWPADAAGLVRLAQLDSAPAAAAELPGLAGTGDVLVATIDGDLAAALSLNDGLLVADPFHRTDDHIALLHLRAAQIADARPRRRPSLQRLGVLRPRLH
jgi:hypothetical protein